MGADIHGFVERRTPAGWVATTSEDLYLGRDYPLFTLLAGVRRWPGVPAGVPKGLPPDASTVVIRRCHDQIVETQDEIDGKPDEDMQCYITRANAQPLIAAGRPVVQRDGHDFIPDGYYHSHTWFTDQELATIETAHIRYFTGLYGERINHMPMTSALDIVARAIMRQAMKGSSDIALVRGIMRDGSADGSECRFVCWFDN